MLGISSDYLQPDFAARVRVDMTASEMLEMAERARGKWERDELVAIPFKREPILEAVSKGMWSPHALYALAVA